MLHALQLSLVTTESPAVVATGGPGILGGLDVAERQSAVVALARMIAKAAATPPSWDEEDGDE